MRDIGERDVSKTFKEMFSTPTFSKLFNLPGVLTRTSSVDKFNIVANRGTWYRVSRGALAPDHLLQAGGFSGVWRASYSPSPHHHQHRGFSKPHETSEQKNCKVEKRVPHQGMRARWLTLRGFHKTSRQKKQSSCFVQKVAAAAAGGFTLLCARARVRQLFQMEHW